MTKCYKSESYIAKQVKTALKNSADKGYERYRCWSADNLSKNFIETVCLESDF